MKDGSPAAISVEQFSSIAIQLKPYAAFPCTRDLKAQHAAIREASVTLLPSTLRRQFVGSH